MIKMLRLDERMIHGQVAIKWSRHLSVDRIIVASDSASSNEVIQKSLMMAAPPTVKVAIKSVEQAIEILNDARCDSLKILVIAALIDDVLAIVKEVKNIPLVNIGNYGRIAAKQGTDTRKSFGHNLYLYPSEEKQLSDLIGSNIETIYQTTPDDAPIPLKKVLGL